MATVIFLKFLVNDMMILYAIFCNVENNNNPMLYEQFHI